MKKSSRLSVSSHACTSPYTDKTDIMILIFENMGKCDLTQFGESSVAELRIHSQKSLLERMDVFNALG